MKTKKNDLMEGADDLKFKEGEYLKSSCTLDSIYSFDDLVINQYIDGGELDLLENKRENTLINKKYNSGSFINYEYDVFGKDTELKEWSSWVKKFKVLSSLIISAEKIHDITNIINSSGDIDFVKDKLNIAFKGYEELVADISLRKSIINFLKHYPELRKHTSSISISYNYSLNLIALSLLSNNPDGRYINVQFESNGSITFFSKDIDKEDSAYSVSGTMFSAAKISKAYKIKYLFSILDDKWGC